MGVCAKGNRYLLRLHIFTPGPIPARNGLMGQQRASGNRPLSSYQLIKEPATKALQIKLTAS